MISIYYFLERRSEVAYKRAADTAGIHLGYLDSCFFKEATVDTDIAELVLNKYYLLVIVTVCYELLDKSGLACSQKARENIYLC